MRGGRCGAGAGRTGSARDGGLGLQHRCQVCGGRAGCVKVTCVCGESADIPYIENAAGMVVATEISKLIENQPDWCIRQTQGHSTVFCIECGVSRFLEITYSVSVL